MLKVNVTKNLIALEDLLLGEGTAVQQRGPSGTPPVTVTKITGANLPYDASFSLQEKFDLLEGRMDTLPEVVDQDGNLLTGLINSSVTQLNLIGRLWRLDLGTTAKLYYGTEFLFEYHKANGNIVIPEDTNYIAADLALQQLLQAADASIILTLNTLVASLRGGAYVDVGTSPNQLVQLDSSGRLPAVDGSQLTNINIIPVGAIISVIHAAPVAGWLDLDGSLINRTMYPLLFGLYGTAYGVGDGVTTFGLPDLRGQFLRVWDNSKGVDVGRTLGSVQDDAIKIHSHQAGTLVTGSAGAHTHTVPNEGTNQNSNQALMNDNGSSSTQFTNTSSAGAHTHTITGATADTGAIETRPKNVAVRVLVRAG